MKKFTEKIYWVFFIIFILLFLWILFSFHLDIDAQKQATDFTTISDYSVETLADESTPKGIRQRCTFTLDAKDFPFCHLIFYSIHQNVEISLEGSQIYSLAIDKRNSFGKTPGSIWNMIAISESDMGKKVQIDFIPVYDSAIDVFPTLYYGDRYDILSSQILNSLPALFLSTIAILAGVFYICFYLFAKKKGNGADNSLIMLGTFAILIGIWKLSDLAIFSFLVNNNLTSAYLPFFSLILACVPYNFFIRNQHSSKEHWAWHIPSIVCYISMSLEIVLQLLHMADFRETLILTHISIFIMVTVIIIMMIKEIYQNGFEGQLRKNILCICACIVGLVIDTIIYYATNSQGTLICGMIGFNIYIFVLGVNSIQEIRKLIMIAQEAKKYEELAFHDEMTGFFNRTAYADYLGKDEFDPSHTIVAMFDLNNLKICNDEFGHDQGDIYITTCAKLILDCFGDIGNCYRIGGDEFCVLMNEITLELCKSRIATLNRKVTEANAKHFIDCKMQIASGYVLYDKRLDFDIQDTIRRADKMMYKVKYEMKHQNKVDKSTSAL